MGGQEAPRVAVIMGSKSDWPTMKRAVGVLDLLDVSTESKIVSAHRTPDLLFEYVGCHALDLEPSALRVRWMRQRQDLRRGGASGRSL